ncbi:MAG: hypothetical protein QM775_33260 [Pirellulales bacterium]
MPDELLDVVQAGCRVKVPLGRGNRPMTGYCVRLETKPLGARRLKDIEECLDDVPLVRPPLLRLTQWMSEYYLSEWGQVLESVVPAGVRMQAGTKLTTLLSLADEYRGKLEELPLPKKQKRVLEILQSALHALTPQQLAAAAQCTLAPITTLRRKGMIRSQAVRLQTTDIEHPVHAHEENHALNDDQQRAARRRARSAPCEAARNDFAARHHRQR